MWLFKTTFPALGILPIYNIIPILNIEFDELIDTYLANNIGISNHVLSTILSAQLRTALLTSFENQNFSKAKIGDKQNEIEHKAIRSDKIFWLDRKHNNEEEHLFLDKMDEFITYLNRTCFTGIKSCEFHYAMFNIGDFYSKHKDSFQQHGNRAFSMIHYLNPNWETVDGGELAVYQNNEQQLIEPTNGKTVFFKSTDLMHEVLATTQQRLSITGWLKT